MKHLLNIILLVVVMAGCCLAPGGVPQAAAAAPEVLVLNVAGSINPAVADFIRKGVRAAQREGAACLVITLDTPGGLAESMRSIVKAIFSSEVPVVVYVSPGGARAASAGVMITLAADIAAMAPGTNIGAAHPVGAGGREIGGKMSEKVLNDMAALARSIATKRGRNTAWAEAAVRASAALTENEALRKNVIDFVARDIHDLMRKINGRPVAGKGTLRLDGAVIKTFEESLRTRILRRIGDPNIAYILMMIGLAGLYFELAHPGAIFPGVVGGIAIILAFFAFQTLPVNTAGMLLILLAVVFFILEIKVTSYGLLSLAGVGALLLGSLMLFDEGPSGLRVSLQVLVPTTGAVSVFFMAVAALAFKAHRARPRTGKQGLIGEVGVVKQALDPEGKVLVHGELWKARAADRVPEGARVRVVGVEDGLQLVVAPMENNRKESKSCTD